MHTCNDSDGTNMMEPSPNMSKGEIQRQIESIQVLLSPRGTKKNDHGFESKFYRQVKKKDSFCGASTGT